MRILIDVEQDTATPMLRGLRSGLANRTQLNRAGAEGMLPLVERNFRGMAAGNRNRFGAPSTFWNQMLSGTHAGADESAGWVAMPRAVALRYFGGTVTPKVAKNLAIPANAEAYGKSPKDFADLRFVMFGPGGAKALVQRTSQAIGYRKQRGGGVKITQGPVIGGEVFFWLVPSATIKPNPNVLPAPNDLVDAARGAIGGWLDLQARRRR